MIASWGLSLFWRRFAALGLGLLVMISLAITVVGQEARLTEDEAIAQIDQNITSMVESANDFSGVVLIGRGDEIIFSKGYGYAVTEWEVPNTTDSVFRIGSLTKQFTGMAIIKLQEEGLLDVDDPICDYLADCSDTWSDITIYHLLTHSSGIPDYTAMPTVMRDLMLSNRRPEAAVAAFRDEALLFEPGTDYRYSNSGYHLLGDIIDEVSGTSYGRYLQVNFFEPLGMENTKIDRNAAVIPHRAEGYASLYVRADYINMQIPYSAGGLVSTVEDLFKWQRALYTGQIVSQESLNEMWSREVEIGDGGVYAYGISRYTSVGYFDDAEEDFDAYVHAGGIPGYSSAMNYVPKVDMVFIVLTNREIFDPFDVLLMMMGYFVN